MPQQEISQDVVDQSAVIADQALTGLNGAANVFDSIVSQGEDLVALANDAVTGLELSDQKNVDIARAAIDRFYNTSAG